jgi:ketosteroid isomerase-like protein
MASTHGPTSFEGLDAREARRFAERWLPAWTGNDPDRLASFYADDAFYSDPAIPEGVRGRKALRAYFATLLARNPDWVWTQVEATPLEGGFLNHWHARIPVAGGEVACAGVCTVRLRDGLIVENRVWFDRAELLRAVAR